MKLTNEEYMAMPTAKRIAAYYAEIDETIESSPNKEHLRTMQNALDQVRFRHQGKPEVSYNLMKGWTEQMAKTWSGMLDCVDARLGKHGA